MEPANNKELGSTNPENQQNTQVSQGEPNESDLYAQLSADDEKRLFEFLNKVQVAAQREGEENIGLETISQIQQWRDEFDPNKNETK